MKEFYKGWYVLYVKSRHEKKVQESLIKISLDSYLPMIKELRKRSDRKIIIEKPLFPAYIFVNIKSSADFYKVLSINGVCSYIRFGKEFAKISENEINKIKILTTTGEVLKIEVSSDLLEIGSLMGINSGPLNGLQCKVLKVNSDHKIIVHIESLRQNITATIPSSYLINDKIL